MSGSDVEKTLVLLGSEEKRRTKLWKNTKPKSAEKITVSESEKNLCHHHASIKVLLDRKVDAYAEYLNFNSNNHY